MLKLSCDHLFDGDRLHGPSVLTIDNGLVAEVRPLASDEAEEGDHVPFVMPGLIDAHVHISGYREGSPAGNPFATEKNFMRLCAYTGVTTVRDTGNSLETLAYVREWTERYDGPRVQGSGPLLDSPPLTWPFSRTVRTSAEVQRCVGLLADEGVDWIKAYRNVTPDLMSDIVRSAAEHELPVAADCGKTDADTAAKAGVRSLEHAVNLLAVLERDISLNGHSDSPSSVRWGALPANETPIDKLAETLLTHGTFLVPTLLVTRRLTHTDEMAEDPYLDYAAIVMPYNSRLKKMRNPVGRTIGRRYMAKFLPESTLSGADAELATLGTDRIGATVVSLHEAGVRIAVGTDSPNPSLAPGYSMQQEMRELQHQGLAALDVLRAATATGGELLNDVRLGTLRAGSHADLLALNGDPSNDVDELKTLDRVMLRGRWTDRPAVAKRLQNAMNDGD